eukprot:TRINITY_DN8222_c0_g1_i1.p1 TRINITY_DN8222_c0_g1~~TRINITY_DN8222_c0_g1_i1.p1  ORF type:complete len:546 (+),score=135.50 TRINITY_DN8222_c0_g1_i1:74-1639(+)
MSAPSVSAADKEYLVANQTPELIDRAVCSLLEEKPDDQRTFLAKHFGGIPPLSLAATMPVGHDLTLETEHATYVAAAELLYRNSSLEDLRALEKATADTTELTKRHPTIFHIAVKDAISKKLMDSFPPLHCTVVFALYHENNRMLPKGHDHAGESHPNGEDFIRRKHKQMSWLFENRRDCSWSLLGVDDGCDRDSAGLMESIVAADGFDNVAVHRLKTGVKEGCSVLDCDKLKSEDWNESDLLVKASQKGGAIIYGLHLATQKETPGKEHLIMYTDSDLSSDLRLCGLNFATMLTDGFDCSVSERFGIPGAVNCSAKHAETGGVIPGLARDSIVHLTLRHKLRMRLLPPLSPIIDTNCGHKGIKAKALAGVLKMVRDYKGSFDMDWLMCVGICGKAAGRKPIGVTPVAWVASVAESNFWGGGGGKTEDPAEAKLRSMTSWHKIFAKMAEMNGWHKEKLQAEGLLSPEDEQWVDWIKSLDVQAYMRLVDAIQDTLKGQEPLAMPEPTIMGFDLETCKKLAGQ